MTKKGKLIKAIRNNLRAVRFDDACRIAEMIGFSLRGGKGSHKIYGRQDEPLLLNFQNRRGYIKPYQAKQLIDMVDKYDDESS